MGELLIELYAVLPALKPTIVNGKWINLPPPPQDTEWLKRHASDNAKGQAR